MITLHVDLGPEWRGGQNQALLLIQGLRERGHVAELVALAESPLAKRAEVVGVRVYAVGRKAVRLRAALQLRRLLDQGRCEIVHCHEAHGLTAAWVAGVHRRAALVASRRVAYPLSKNRLALARYRRAHRIVAVSRFVGESTIRSGLPKEQIEIIYDGIQITPLPVPEARLAARRRWNLGDAPVLGCVGYLLPDKGQELLVKALPIIREQYGNSRLLLAGDGHSRVHLEQLARDLGVRDAVEFAGFVDNVAQVYQALDIFLFPSFAEALGSSLLAAMAYGLPPVALAGGAVPEIIEDGRNGLLVPGPQPAGIAAAVLKLLRDSSLAAQLGLAARRTIEQRFSAGRMVQDTVDLYRRVCARQKFCGPQ